MTASDQSSRMKRRQLADTGRHRSERIKKHDSNNVWEIPFSDGQESTHQQELRDTSYQGLGGTMQARSGRYHLNKDAKVPVKQEQGGLIQTRPGRYHSNKTGRYHSNKEREVPFKQGLGGTRHGDWEVPISKDWKTPFKQRLRGVNHTLEGIIQQRTGRHQSARIGWHYFNKDFRRPRKEGL